jgi:hypothetical protein
VALTCLHENRGSKMAKVDRASNNVRSHRGEMLRIARSLRDGLSDESPQVGVFLYVDYDDHWDLNQCQPGLGHAVINKSDSNQRIAEIVDSCIENAWGYDRVRGPQDPIDRDIDIARGNASNQPNGRS